MPKLRGVVFDLDGTVVDSRLDFDRMREEIGIPGRQPVLEFVESQPEGEFKRRCREILLEHEFRGAREATLMPEMVGLLERLSALNLRQGILTRNTRGPTQLTLERLGLAGFSPVLTREDAPPKPDPLGLLMICEEWGVSPEEVIFVGDYRFDLLAGRRAGTKTVLYTSLEKHSAGLPDYHEDADFVTSSFGDWAGRFSEIAAEHLGFDA